MKKHKWFNEIIAFAEGKEIQYRFTDDKGYSSVWYDVNSDFTPSFNAKNHEFRAKPETDYLYQWEIQDKHTGEFLLSHHVRAEVELGKYKNKQRYFVIGRYEKSKKQINLKDVK